MNKRGERGPGGPAPAARSVGIGAVLGAALLLKWFYRSADSAGLAWLIGPTARAVELVSALSFSYEAGYGWVDPNHGVVIAPACAGVNFLVICGAMTAAQVVWKSRSWTMLLAGPAAAAAGSLAVTVGANAARILLSEFLYRFDTLPFGLSGAAAHRLAGVCIYYLTLCACCQGLARLLAAPRRPVLGTGEKRQVPVSQLALLVPLGSYLAVSLGVPVITGAYGRAPELFLTHAATILAATLALTVFFGLASYGLGRVRRRDVSGWTEKAGSPRRGGRR